jgi:hypothetical protein
VFLLLRGGLLELRPREGGEGDWQIGEEFQGLTFYLTGS